MDWSTPACQWLGPEAGVALGILCLALAMLLLGVVWLGFGPLRARFGPGKRSAPSDLAAVDGQGGLIVLWRLYRQLGQREPGARLVRRAESTTESRTTTVV